MPEPTEADDTGWITSGPFGVDPESGFPGVTIRRRTTRQARPEGVLMSTNPRNPRYFPRMKVRGAQRRRVAPMQRATGAFDRMNVAMRIAAMSMFKITAKYPSKES